MRETGTGSSDVSFTLTELASRCGEVVEAACRGPVEITGGGQGTFVLLTAEDFDRLRAGSTQRACRTDRLTPEERKDFLDGLEQVASARVEPDDPAASPLPGPAASERKNADPGMAHSAAGTACLRP